MFSYLRFRYRRQIRRMRRDIRALRKWSANYIQRHIWGKWHQVSMVRRFLAGWLVVILIAGIGLSQQIGSLRRVATIAVPASGGVYTEAAVGTVQSLNPVLPESATASDINRLIFSGLTRYDARRQLVPDLATWDVSPDGKSYTFHLRHDVKWHDGIAFTASDVAFTLTAIQNPDSRSPLASSWQGVKVDIKDDYTVVFSLPQPLASFMDSTTVGIIPRHLLESVEPSQLRTTAFNQRPIGTGPFKIKTFAPSAKEIELSANPNYFLGHPLLDQFNFKFYDTAEATLQAYAQHQVTSPGRIWPTFSGKAQRQAHLTQYDLTLPEEETLFFASKDPLLRDKPLRAILSRSLDRDKIMQTAASGQGMVVTQPLLPGQVGYTNKYAPAPLDAEVARQALEEAGWRFAKDSNIRTKNNAKLSFKLITLRGGELERAAREIKRQWAEIGVGIDIVTADNTELQQTYMRPRNFQMLLYGVNLGSDPDVYSYWHSTQIEDPGVNLSGYSSSEADKALEAGRIKSDPLVRAGKYDSFLKVWNADIPAVVLYQSGYTYAARQELAGIKARRLVVPADRYYGVERWTIRQRLAPTR